MVEENSSELKPAKKPRRWKRVLIELIIVAALVAASYGLWKNPQITDQIRAAVDHRMQETENQKPLNEEFAAEQANQSQIEALSAQMQALQKQVDLLSATPAADRTEDLAAMDQKIAIIEKTNLNVIDSKADVATVLGLLTRMDKAEARLDKLVKVTDQGALILTATMLVKDSAERGGNFEYEMEVLNQIAADNTAVKPQLEVMSRYAVSGIVSAGQLKKEFEPIYKRLTKAEKEAFDQTWTDRINSKLSEIVQIKRVNEDAPQFEVSKGLEKVRRDVAEGNLPAAVKELKQPENAKLLGNEALKKWLDQAQANVAFNAAINRISAHSLALLKVNFIRKEPN